MHGWLGGCLIDRLNDWLPSWLTDFLSYKITGRLLADWLPGLVDFWLPSHTNASHKEYLQVAYLHRLNLVYLWLALSFRGCVVSNMNSGFSSYLMLRVLINELLPGCVESMSSRLLDSVDCSLKFDSSCMSSCGCVVVFTAEFDLPCTLHTKPGSFHVYL
jgi:hypothetical protein